MRSLLRTECRPSSGSSNISGVAIASWSARPPRSHEAEATRGTLSRGDHLRRRRRRSRVACVASAPSCGRACDILSVGRVARPSIVVLVGAAAASVRRGARRPSELVGVSTGATIHELSLAIEYMSPDERTAGRSPREATRPRPGRRGDTRAGCATARGGGHDDRLTRRHDALVWLSDDALDAALRDGRAELEQAGHALDVIAYPHGHADDRVAEAARAAGFVIGFGVADQAVWPDSDPLLQGRITPTYRSAGHFCDPACAGAVGVVGDERAAPHRLPCRAPRDSALTATPGHHAARLPHVRALVGGLTEFSRTFPDQSRTCSTSGAGLAHTRTCFRRALAVGLDVEGNPYGVADVVSDALLPFADESFDLVTCIQAFQYIPGPEHAVSEFQRVLRRAAPSSSRRCSVTGTSAPTSRRGTPSKCSARSSPAGTTSTFARTAGARSLDRAHRISAPRHGAARDDEECTWLPAARVPRVVCAPERARPRARARRGRPRGARGSADEPHPYRSQATTCLRAATSRSSSRRGADGGSCRLRRCPRRSSRRTSTTR